MAYGWHLEGQRLRPLRDRSVVMASALQDSSSQLNSKLRDFVGQPAEEYLVKRALLDVEAVERGWQSNPQRLQELAMQIRGYEADPLETIAATDGVALVLEKQNAALQHYQGVLEQDITAERQRVEQYLELQAALHQRQTALDTQQEQLKIKRKGLELLHRASRHAIGHFNQIVHERSRGLLSDFTQANYRELEFDPRFVIKVLSEEKGDYLDFEEISAGTQRQIALAMRLSLAGTLAYSTGAEQQFLFLDEPFAFFDPQRTAATINSLKHAVSKGPLSQIWFTVQDLPPGLDDALVIDCQLHNRELDMRERRAT
ncbi:MAG: hypothetical protein R3E89_16760 [Thiolinea sp.]